MIASLDGGATDDGKAGGLAGPGDRAVFALMRQTADVILVGAGTVRIENYSGAQIQRRPTGRPASAAARPRCRRSPSSPTPAGSTTTPRCSPAPRCAPLILTCTQTAADLRTRLGSAAEVIDASVRTPTASTRPPRCRVLADRGLWRVLTEGGPQFLGMLIEAGCSTSCA